MIKLRGKHARKDKMQPQEHCTGICAKVTSTQNFQEHKGTDNIQLTGTGHRLSLKLHCERTCSHYNSCFVTDIRMLRLQREKSNLDGSRNNLSQRTHLQWLGHCQKLTESEVSVYSPGSKVHLFIFGGGTHTYHWMCGSQDTTCRYWFLFPPHGSLGSNSGGQGDNKDLYSLSRLSSPSHLVLKAM